MATKAKTTTTKTTRSKGRQPVTRPAPDPTPVLIEMHQQRCLVPDCPRYEVRRGLCHPCAAHAGALVRAGHTTWEALEAAGKARPLAKDAPKGDLPYRQAWLLGTWNPGDPWPPGDAAVVVPPPDADEEARAREDLTSRQASGGEADGADDPNPVVDPIIEEPPEPPVFDRPEVHHA